MMLESSGSVPALRNGTRRPLTLSAEFDDTQPQKWTSSKPLLFCHPLRCSLTLRFLLTYYDTFTPRTFPFLSWLPPDLKVMSVKLSQIVWMIIRYKKVHILTFTAITFLSLHLVHHARQSSPSSSSALKIKDLRSCYSFPSTSPMAI